MNPPKLGIHWQRRPQSLWAIGINFGCKGNAWYECSIVVSLIWWDVAIGWW